MKWRPFFASLRLAHAQLCVWQNERDVMQAKLRLAEALDARDAAMAELRINEDICSLDAPSFLLLKTKETK